ncbi:MAG TPA: glycosyltransferase 87 family protein, partial [Anaerolineales bacterium]|nr:glycosyltransferase 87 family protein [Anaerolineales bacterium]
MAFKDIRKSRRWLSAEDIRFLVLALILVLGLLAVNIYLARTLPGGEWFFQRWSGMRAFLTLQADASAEGVKGARIMPDGLPVTLAGQTHPYSTEIARRTQQVAYGRPAFSSEYSYVLNDPFHILMLYTPLAFLREFTWARGLWALLCEVALVGSVVLALNLSEWQPPRWLYALLILFGLFSLFSLTALVTGSPSILLAFLYLWVLIALRSHSDELAGLLLALVAYQWEVGGLFVLYIIFFTLANRRWGVLAGLAMSLFVLLVVSFMVYQGWGLPYLRAVISAWLRGADLSL